MDPLKDWCDALERILVEHAAVPYSHGDIRSEVVIDRERGRYLLVDVGWQGGAVQAVRAEPCGARERRSAGRGSCS